MKELLKLTLLCIISLFIMTLINSVSPMIGLVPFIGMGDLGYVIFHIIILFLTIFIFSTWIIKVLDEKLINYRITKPKFFKSCMFLGLLGLLINYVLYLTFTNGEWVLNSEKIVISSIVIIVTSLTTAVTEEYFFRGFLMGYIEKKTNLVTGLIISSLLFSVVHLMSGQYDFINVIQITVSIFIAGLLYGLMTIFYRTIWASIIVHFLFDVTQLFDINTKKLYQGVAEYTYRSHSQLINGGEYGSTVSVFTTISFLILVIIMVVKISRNSSFEKLTIKDKG